MSRPAGWVPTVWAKRTRQEELEDLLWIRLSPLRRFLFQRVQNWHGADADLFDEAGYEADVAKFLRVHGICQTIKARLYPNGESPLDLWARDGNDDSPLPAEL